MGSDSKSKPNADSSSERSESRGTASDGDSVADGAARRTAQPLPEQFGRYRIVRMLGEGAMGQVFLAHDDQLDRDVALKVPRFSAKGDEERIERFYREARAAATLRHPNVCPIHDVGEFEGRPFLTMAYIEGRPLSDYVWEGKPLPQRQAAIIVRKLARGLAAAHEEEVTHRDLKPANVMIDERNEPIVMDFGLAQRERDNEAQLTKDGTLLGTPAYMPPEQVIGDAKLIGPPADIYSLGVVLYELLTGELPFQGPVNVVLAQVLNVEPPPPSELRPGLDPDLDPDLEAICQRAMAKSIEDRFSSMDELDKALTAHLRQGRSSTGKMTVVGTAANKPTQAGTQLDLKPEQPDAVDATTSSNGEWFRQRWQWIVAISAAVFVSAFAIYTVVGPNNNSGQAGANGNHVWKDVTVYPVAKTQFLSSRFRWTWFSVNSTPNVDPKHHASISTHSSQHSRNGKWFVIHPSSNQPAEIVFRFNRPIFGFRAVAKMIHPKGHVGISIFADDVLMHETKDVLGTSEAQQITEKVDGFTELRIEIDCRGMAKDDQLLIADPEILTDPQAVPDPTSDSTQTGQFLQIWQNTSAVVDCLFSPDSRSLVTGHKSGAVWAWDLETGKRLRGFSGLKAYPQFAISRDGKRLLAADKFGARIWNFEDGKELSAVTFNPSAGFVRVAATPTGFQALIERKKHYQLWDLETDQPIFREFAHLRSPVAGLELSPDGNRAFYIGTSGLCAVWDLQSRLAIRRRQANTIKPIPDDDWPEHVHGDMGFASTISEDGQLGLAVGVEGFAILCDLIEFKEIRWLKGHTSAVRSAAISADNRFAITGGGLRRVITRRSEQPDFSVRMWDLETGKELRRFEGHTDSVTHLAISPDGRFAASRAADLTIRLWRLPEVEK
ncbi:MAG: protein kinase [Planctomycetaceae bacterium]|nr:protein kinase [Planctomycetaceae bacterium]MBT6487416.1 protein kinase [Planctomycetaceae bacterium]MBT6495992.1 protein kinase [Planctomycetaceae bacterium]